MATLFQIKKEIGTFLLMLEKLIYWYHIFRMWKLQQLFAIIALIIILPAIVGERWDERDTYWRGHGHYLKDKGSAQAKSVFIL